MFKTIKFILIISLMIVSLQSSYCQVIKIRIYDSINNPVMFVTIYDTTLKHNYFTDSTGLATIPFNKYSNQSVFKVSHVSFNTIFIDSKKDKIDSVINIYLFPKNISLSDIVIHTNKKKYTLIDYGNYKRRSDGSRLLLNLNQKTNFGFYIPNSNQNINSKLHSISFKLSETKKVRKQNFIIEIKLYQVDNSIISNLPINYKPIYIFSKDIQNNNEVLVNQNIPFGENGLFVSLEIPYIENTTDNVSLNLEVGSLIR